MRIVIVADNTLAAEGIRRELRHASGCHVAGFVKGRRPCADAVAQEAPDVVLVDDMLRPELTLARVAEVRRALPEAKIVLVTLEMTPARLAEACAAGIDAAVAKTAHPGSLGTLVREVVRGNVFHAFLPTPTPEEPALDRLTSREVEILALAAAGLPNSRIADRLCVTEQTVKFHLSNVYRKLSVTNRTQASRIAHEHGLLELSPTFSRTAAPISAAA
jgi:DNA-binding NarL/FixJ family response regulator